jgi:hypothetical protein
MLLLASRPMDLLELLFGVVDITSAICWGMTRDITKFTRLMLRPRIYSSKDQVLLSFRLYTG